MNFRGYVVVDQRTRIWGDFELNGGIASFCTDGRELRKGTIVQILKPDTTKRMNYCTPAENLGKWEVQGITRNSICGSISRQKSYDLQKLI